MLAIVEALKEYKNFLLGANITIYTDHKNLLSNSTVSDRVFRWKQKIQEFGPILNYIKGHENTEADVLSRLPTDNSTIEVMLNHPPVDPYNLLLNKNPMDLTYIHHHQKNHNNDDASLALHCSTLCVVNHGFCTMMVVDTRFLRKPSSAATRSPAGMR